MATIAVNDTVRIAGERGKGIVEQVTGTTVDVTITSGNARRGGLRTTYLTGVSLSRVTLIRKGNHDDDVVTALFSKMDADAAGDVAGSITAGELLDLILDNR